MNPCQSLQTLQKTDQVAAGDTPPAQFRSRSYALVAVALAITSLSPLAGADDDASWTFGDRDSISLATGGRQAVQRAPAVATVITAEEIAAIGATDLDEVLATVPGLHVGRNPNSYGPRYLLRGMSSTYNAEILLLVDGVPMTSLYTGDRGNAMAGQPIDNIARIEVVRGPGSALYGAEAMSGVINIVTKRAGDIDGTRLGIRAGSFATRDAYVLHGGRWGEIAVAAYLRRGTTDGQKEIVAADQQSAFDAATGGDASLAPGPVAVGHRATDAQLDLGLHHWRFNAGLKKREGVGTGAGVGSALDPVGKSDGERTNAELSFEQQDFAEDFGLRANLGYFRFEESSRLLVFPPGGFFGGFPDGMIGNPAKWERHGRFGLTMDYRGIANHHLRWGVGYEKLSIYKVRESKNFNPDFSPIGQVVDVSDTVPFLRPHDRYLRYAYVQDEWTMLRDWTLTAGVRQDRYSDFGETTNPRLALVWDAAHDLTVKLLVGRAFRAPTFVERYAINNPVALGSPELRPEHGETEELALVWKPTPALQLGVNYYEYQRRDVIEYVVQQNGTAVTRNIGKIDGRGGEFELAWQIDRSLRLTANAAILRVVDHATGHATGDAPRESLYLRLDGLLAPGLQASAQINHVADRRRSLVDTRAPVPDYTSADFTLRTRASGFNVAFSLRNAFNADVREPAPAAIPYDLPMPGRQGWIEFTQDF